MAKFTGLIEFELRAWKIIYRFCNRGLVFLRDNQLIYTIFNNIFSYVKIKIELPTNKSIKR